MSTVITEHGQEIHARLVVDATGYKPVFLKHRRGGPVAIQTCYGVVGRFNKNPVELGQFVLMDYRSDHLTEKEKKEPVQGTHPQSRRRKRREGEGEELGEEGEEGAPGLLPTKTCKEAKKEEMERKKEKKRQKRRRRRRRRTSRRRRSLF